MREVEVNEEGGFADLVRTRMQELPKAQAKVQTYAYASPTLGSERPRAVTRLVTTDILVALVQKFTNGGGEVTMHSHTGMDGFWMVLSGRARFHFEGGEPLEFGPQEGLATPRDVRYWFEQVGDGPLEILQVDAVHPAVKNRIVNHSELPMERADRAARRVLFDAQTSA